MKQAQDYAARMLIRFRDQTQRGVAAYLNMGTGGAVSAQVRRLPGMLAAESKLRRTVPRIAAGLKPRRKELYASRVS